MLKCFVICFISLPGARAQLPNIVSITADDWGWAAFSPHRAVPTPEVVTPRLAALAAEGILLDRHYAFMYCSPSRSAFHSGRNPIRVNVWNDDLRVSNASEHQWGQGGIPRSMTGIAARLSAVGYDAHHIGKWHGGLAHPFNTPVGRGFRSSYGYLGACVCKQTIAHTGGYLSCAFLSSQLPLPRHHQHHFPFAGLTITTICRRGSSAQKRQSRRICGSKMPPPRAPRPTSTSATAPRALQTPRAACTRSFCFARRRLRSLQRTMPPPRCF